jgi:hypothetical protein
MKPRYQVREGWIEVIIDDSSCNYERFEEAANVLKKHFRLTFSQKSNHLDDAYWDFRYKDCDLTLHHNHFLGTSLFPTAFGGSTLKENECAKEIGTLLFEKLHSPV